MAATIERLLPIDEQALLKAYVEGSSEPAHAAAIYDTLEVPANERSGQRSFSLKSPRSDGSIRDRQKSSGIGRVYVPDWLGRAAVQVALRPSANAVA
jgi:hypothetical protein